ncbi:molybdate ABC transporter substrate-binding protein [Paenibacillaceae bacterium WGS1546]|uniref:molybdate ABC transporter substrate-binding protein n=1 Tax=Cohnella sp. WGS1546 TaxID=3366810 RepID=UPI00372D3532
MHQVAKIGSGLVLLAALSFGLFACDSRPGTDSGQRIGLTVSAAASLTDVLNELRPAFEAAHPDIGLAFNFGASGALQRQIEQGAPADVFLSASTRSMRTLADKGLVDTGRLVDLLVNELVLVVPSGGELGLASVSDLANTDMKRIAIGIPDTVPAGSYAKEALTRAGLWEKLQPQLVQAKDVRQVLQYVETGNADAGFVYRTDALTSDRVEIAFAADPDSYSPAVYPMGIVSSTKREREAVMLFDFLQSKEAAAVFEKFGFAAREAMRE